MTKGATFKALPAAIAGLALMAASGAAAGTVAPDSVPIEDMELKQSLSGAPGDAVAGREAFADRKKGNCLACHANADLNDQLFHGEVGPVLDGVADRWNERAAARHRGQLEGCLRRADHHARLLHHEGRPQRG